MTFAPLPAPPDRAPIVRGPNAADTFTLSNTAAVADGLTVSYSGVQQIQLKGGTGASLRPQLQFGQRL